jgi:hypothetical protein
MGISSQASKEEGPETTKYKHRLQLLAKDDNMNKKDRAVLYGLAVGDGHISYRKRLKDGKYPYTSASIVLGHSPKQEDYLTHKVELLHSILGGKKPSVQKTNHTLSNGETYPGRRVEKGNTYFKQMHRVLYPTDNKKCITGQVLSYMDAHSLALWYMDDGSILQNKNKQGEVTSLSFRICTQVSEEEAGWIVDWLKNQFGVEAKSFVSKGKYDIGGATQATLALVNTIADYVVPCMLYKVSPAFKFVFRKSAKHPNFTVDDDIVRALGNSKPKEV